MTTTSFNPNPNDTDLARVLRAVIPGHAHDLARVERDLADERIGGQRDDVLLGLTELACQLSDEVFAMVRVLRGEVYHQAVTHPAFAAFPSESRARIADDAARAAAQEALGRC